MALVDDLRKRAKPVAAVTGLTVSAILGTALLVIPHEGERLAAYADAANPAIATICYGETQGVKFGDKASQDECRQRLVERLPDYIVPVKRLLPDIPENRLIAYGDAAWNLGVGVLTRRSVENKRPVPGTSIVDLERAGQWQQACARLKEFVYAGGKRLPGLVKRREAEYLVCMGSHLIEVAQSVITLHFAPRLAGTFLLAWR
jgi:lysozyme